MQIHLNWLHQLHFHNTLPLDIFFIHSQPNIHRIFPPLLNKPFEQLKVLFHNLFFKSIFIHFLFKQLKFQWRIFIYFYRFPQLLILQSNYLFHYYPCILIYKAIHPKALYLTKFFIRFYRVTW